MTISPSYPGIYIQELPSSSHTITPAPTSIAAFVGYSHPYQTKQFYVAQQCFSFTDYVAAFGPLFSSGLIDPSLPRAVYQFFLNGGSTAWVVGLQPGLLGTGTSAAKFGTASTDMQFTVEIATDGGGILFTALQPADAVALAVQVSNVNSTTKKFDLVVTYGGQIETYRGLSLTAASLATVTSASQLVSISAPAGGFGSISTTKPAAGSTTFPTYPNVNEVATPISTFDSEDYLNPGAGTIAVFEANSTLDNVEIFNLLLTPGVTDFSVVSAALAFAESKRAFMIVDPPPQAPAFTTAGPPPSPIVDWMTTSGLTLPTSQNGALYFPYLISNDPVTGNNVPVAPSGFVAGIYAQTDASRGVWKAPAGLATTILNTSGPVLSGVMTDPQQGVLNLESINCLRSFSGVGTVVWGARTLVAVSQQQWMYVPVRRMTLFIEQTLLANLRWVVFEPNDEPLWIAITNSISAFMLSLFRQGALQGSTPSQAFQVTCDSTTTTPANQAQGIVIIVVAFAPLKPAEFVIVQIAQLAGQTAGS
jgi:phage tail sheath protein FI